jgi:hypothetical protein
MKYGGEEYLEPTAVQFQRAPPSGCGRVDTSDGRAW